MSVWFWSIVRYVIAMVVFIAIMHMITDDVSDGLIVMGALLYATILDIKCSL